MKLKKGVTLTGLNWRMRHALRVAENVFRTYDVELVVTSTTDGKHSKWSWHQFGLAVDLRTRHIEDEGTVILLADDLQRALGIPFEVVVESTHLHVECDMADRLVR